MATHDIIVVGASAGGVEALSVLVGGLPAKLDAAVFVVLHIPPFSQSHLPAILARIGHLPAKHAEHGELIERGTIYIAPPNRHLLIRNDHMELSAGPRENQSRPAIDPLFRSAARAYGPRVIGVVLTGALNDGAMGLSVIAARGGVTIVQDPAEAPFASMPNSALRYARVDYVLPVAEIASLLSRLATEPVAARGLPAMTATRDDRPPIIQHDIDDQSLNKRHNETTVYTCPECGGTLWQLEQNGLIQFNCHVGHVYGPETLLGHMSEELEGALWACVRMFVEKATLTRQLASHLRADGQHEQAARVEEQAAFDDRRGALIREKLLEATPSTVDQMLIVEQAMEEPEESGPRRSRA